MESQDVNKIYLLNDITDVFKSIDEIEFAYTFGSFAMLVKGLSKKNFYNDIDIAIYISEGKKEDFLIFELKMEDKLETLFHIPFDVRILNGAPLPFQYNVLKSGFVILDKNKLLRSDFESLTLKKYFDYVHLRNEYLRETQNASI